MNEAINRRILVIDDQESILEDYRKILGGSAAAETSALKSARSGFFGGGEAAAQEESDSLRFELTTADQGDAGMDMLRGAHERGEPFAVAFVDVRMPPGPDGIQTIKGLWAADPNLQVVICTAYSDYSFEDIVDQLGSSDRLLILKKPFDPVEVRQLAGALTEKWNTSRREREHLEEVRRAEQQARERAEELERMNTALAEANEKAQAASRAKSEFLANMSHEIRTPMNALLGYVDLLCDPNIGPEEQGEFGDTIRKSGEHLLTILNDILDISRIEASRMVINKTDFSPIDLAREVGSLMLTQASEKDLRLELEVPAPIPGVVESDKVRVRQILLNLLGNAIKFTNHGFVKLVLRLDKHEQAEHRYLFFDVVDSGVGISEGELSRVFEAFSQADSSSTRQAGGTGLGLAISKRLAHMLGGDVEATSEPGSGSTFSLRLYVGAVRPAALESFQPDELLLGRGGKAEDAPRDPGRFEGRVLLVEDVKFNQALVMAFLHRAGASVSVAENGQVGYDMAMQSERDGEPFDLVLMDMQMPVLDGYSATRQLRAEGYARPIIALTAHAMAEDRDKCLEAGCTEYITKPLDKVLLLDLCRAVTGGPPPPAALPAQHEPSRQRDAGC